MSVDRLTPTARKVLHLADLARRNGMDGIIPWKVVEVLWADRLKDATTNRRHGYRRRAGTVLSTYADAGWLRIVGFDYSTATFAITDDGIAALEADRALGEVTKCEARVDVRVTGTTPPTVMRRRCKRNALAGSRYCRTHHDHEGTE